MSFHKIWDLIEGTKDFTEGCDQVDETSLGRRGIWREQEEAVTEQDEAYHPISTEFHTYERHSLSQPVLNISLPDWLALS